MDIVVRLHTTKINLCVSSKEYVIGTRLQHGAISWFYQYPAPNIVINRLIELRREVAGLYISLLAEDTKSSRMYVFLPRCSSHRWYQPEGQSDR